MDTFSRRHGHNRADAEISIRYEALDELRDAVVVLAYQCGLKPSDLRQILCAALYRAPDRGNWSEFPNIDTEVHELIRSCEWFEVYDLIEQLADWGDRRGIDFSGEVNRMFRIKGVGWQLINSTLQIRGSEAFELAVNFGTSPRKPFPYPRRRGTLSGQNLLPAVLAKLISPPANLCLIDLSQIQLEASEHDAVA